MVDSGTKKALIVLGIILVIIIIIAIIAAIWYFFFYRRKKVQNAVVAATATRKTKRQLKTFSGALSNNRSLTIYWNDLTSGLYVLNYSGTMQYGCFSAANNVLGGSKVMIYEPEYTGTPVAIPDANVCSNTISQPIATIVLTSPNATGAVNATITSVKSGANNNLNLISGESFILA